MSSTLRMEASALLLFLCICCIAAEAINGCCLCFYTMLITVLILLEAALVGFITIDHHWEKGLPFDPTGELDNFRSFIQDNLDICKWLGIAVVVVQYGLKSSDRHSLPIQNPQPRMNSGQ